MGTTIDPNEPGESCGNCWGPGRPFGDGITPKRVEARVRGNQKGSLWGCPYETQINGNFLLQQTGACWWTYRTSLLLVTWVLYEMHTEFYMETQNQTPNEIIHSTWSMVPCHKILVNDQTSSAGVIAFGGVAGISWGH